MVQPNQNGEPVKELVRRHWDGRAATFDEESQHGIHTGEQHDRWLTVLSESTGDEPRSVLDVGCGTGVISTLLAELGHDVVGVDFAPEMLDRARTKTRRTPHAIEFLRGDAETLPVPDDAFDLLTARHLVWTLPHPVQALREWQRVVEPGGLILLVEGYWNHSEPWDEYEEIHDELPMYDGRPADELREILLREGFAEVDHEPLMDSTLWCREPRHDYYLMTGAVTG